MAFFTDCPAEVRQKILELVFDSTNLKFNPIETKTVNPTYGTHPTTNNHSPATTTVNSSSPTTVSVSHTSSRHATSLLFVNSTFYLDSQTSLIKNARINATSFLASLQTNPLPQWMTSPSYHLTPFANIHRIALDVRTSLDPRICNLVFQRMRQLQTVEIIGLEGYVLKNKHVEAGGLVSEHGQEYLKGNWEQFIGKKKVLPPPPPPPPVMIMGPTGLTVVPAPPAPIQRPDPRGRRVKRILKAGTVSGRTGIRVLAECEVKCVEDLPFEAYAREDMVRERVWSAKVDIDTREVVLRDERGVMECFFLDDLTV